MSHERPSTGSSTASASPLKKPRTSDSADAAPLADTSALEPPPLAPGLTSSTMIPPTDHKPSSTAAADLTFPPEAPTQEPPPRVIDENTDMTTLTDQEIMKLMEGMGQEDVTSRPLISAPVPLSVIRDEYKNGSKEVLKKIDWLQENGWDQVWRARGDGDCFYRSFTIAYFLLILHSSDPPLEANLAFDAIQRALPAMQQVGFDSELYEEFLDPLLELIRGFAPEDPNAERPTEWNLIQLLQDAERSNCIVVALRLMTSAYIRTHEDLFSPFLLSPTTLLPLTTDDFCRQEVEPCGKEADHAQIMALAEALSIGVRIAYLDRSEVHGGDGKESIINWVEFGKDTTDEGKPLTLLYRPGHYDVVTKDVLPTDVPDI